MIEFVRRAVGSAAAVPRMTGAPSGDLLRGQRGLIASATAAARVGVILTLSAARILQDISTAGVCARSRQSRMLDPWLDPCAPMVRVASTLAWPDARRSEPSERSARDSRYTTGTPPDLAAVEPDADEEGDAHRKSAKIARAMTASVERRGAPTGWRGSSLGAAQRSPAP